MAQYSSPLLDDYNRTGVMTPGLSEAVSRVKQRLAPQPEANTAPADQQQQPALSHPQEQTPAITTPGQSAPMTQQPMQNPTPALTHVPTPNEANLTRLENSPSGISGIHHAAARIPLQILDAVGSAFLPGLTEGLPGTQLHHNMLVRQAQGSVTNDQGIQKAGEEAALAPVTRAHTEAETAELGARAGHENAEATAASAKPTNEWVQLSEPVTDPAHPDIGPQPAFFNKNDPSKGLTYGNAPVAAKPTENKPKTEHAVLPDGSVVAIATDKDGKTTASQVYKGDPKVETQLSRIKVGGKLHEVLVNKANGETVKDLGETNEPNAPDRGQNFVDPATNKMVRVEPGGTVPQGARTAAGVNTENTPTTQMRNVGAQAALVHEQTPQMLSEIDRLKDKLGPLAGRWNDFMQGKVGTNDPEFAGLRTDLLMYSSAVALMHARGRLPENLREEFDRTINNPNQNFENLKAVIGKVDQWTSANMHSMQGGGTNAGPKTVKTQAEFDALAPGETYIEDGQKYRKP